MNISFNGSTSEMITKCKRDLFKQTKPSSCQVRYRDSTMNKSNNNNSLQELGLNNLSRTVITLGDLCSRVVSGMKPVSNQSKEKRCLKEKQMEK